MSQEVSDYRLIVTDVIPDLKEVRLYEDTVQHIRDAHPEIPILLPAVQSAVERAISHPAHVEVSYGGSYVFVDGNSTNRAGDPLRVPVKPIGGKSGRVRTAYFATTAATAIVIWKRTDE